MSVAEVSDLIREMHGDIKVLVERVTAIEQHQAVTNGSVATLKANDLRQEGAMSVLKYMLGVTLAIVTAGVGVAGLVLAYVV